MRRGRAGSGVLGQCFERRALESEIFRRYGVRPQFAIGKFGYFARGADADFVKAVAANENVVIAYIVTDEDRLFESVAQELPDHVEPIRLYESYLRNFEIESGRGSL